MELKPDGNSLEIKAEFKTYAVLSGLFWILALFYLYLTFFRGFKMDCMFVSLFCLVVAALWCLWVSGFRITLRDNMLLYRNGFYKTVGVKVEDVQSIKSKWITWTVGFREVSVLRFVIKRYSGEDIIVNQQVFNMHEFLDLISHVDR